MGFRSCPAGSAPAAAPATRPPRRHTGGRARGGAAPCGLPRRRQLLRLLVLPRPEHPALAAWPAGTGGGPSGGLQTSGVQWQAAGRAAGSRRRAPVRLTSAFNAAVRGPGTGASSLSLPAPPPPPLLPPPPSGSPGLLGPSTSSATSTSAPGQYRAACCSGDAGAWKHAAGKRLPWQLWRGVLHGSGGRAELTLGVRVAGLVQKLLRSQLQGQLHAGFI